MNQIIIEISAIILGSAAFAYLAHIFKQPVILAYILAGILLGPVGFGLITDPEFAHATAKIGIIFMLFLVGLEMNIVKLKTIGKTAVIAGVLQVIITGFAGFAALLLFDFGTIERIFLGVALAFSSTIIAIKLLSDSKETKSLFGQIAIGILMVQDILIILALLGLSSLAAENTNLKEVLFMLSMGTILAIAAWIIANTVIKKGMKYIAKSSELIVLTSMGWLFAIVLCAYKIGFSIEIGAFIAGISLANLPYTFEINTRAKALRDFFIVIFFAALGADLRFDSIESVILPIIVMTGFVLFINPLIVQVILKYRGVDTKTGFFTGLTVGNISEFSMVMLTIGVGQGFVQQNTMTMAMSIMIATMAASTYMITYKKQIYKFAKPAMEWLEPHTAIFKDTRKEKHNHIVIIGYDEMGRNVLENIQNIKDEFLVVEHDIEKIEELTERGISCVYGNISDEDLLDELDLQNAEVVIATIAQHEEVIPLLRYIKQIKPSRRPAVLAHAHSTENGLELIKAGADYITLRPYLTAQHFHTISQEIYELNSTTKSDKKKKKLSDEAKNMEKIEKINRRNIKKIKKKLSQI